MLLPLYVVQFIIMDAISHKANKDAHVRVAHSNPAQGKREKRVGWRLFIRASEARPEAERSEQCVSNRAKRGRRPSATSRNDRGPSMKLAHREPPRGWAPVAG